MKRLVFVLAFLGFLVVSDVGAVLGGPVDYVYLADGSFGTMDLQTGAFTFIGPGGTNYEDMTRQISGPIYAADLSTRLLTINTNTGAISSIIGTMGNNIAGLRFGASGTLFGLSHTDLYTVNAASGAVAHVGAFGIASGALFADAFNGNTLYLEETNGPGSTSNLYTVNTNTGAASLVGNIGFQVSSMDFENGTLYGFTVGTQIITINPATATGTFLVNQNSARVVSATLATAVPEPGSTCLFGVGMAGAAVYYGRLRRITMQIFNGRIIHTTLILIVYVVTTSNLILESEAQDNSNDQFTPRSIAKKSVDNLQRQFDKQEKKLLVVREALDREAAKLSDLARKLEKASGFARDQLELEIDEQQRAYQLAGIEVGKEGQEKERLELALKRQKKGLELEDLRSEIALLNTQLDMLRAETERSMSSLEASRSWLMGAELWVWGCRDSLDEAKRSVEERKKAAGGREPLPEIITADEIKVLQQRLDEAVIHSKKAKEEVNRASNLWFENSDKLMNLHVSVEITKTKIRATSGMLSLYLTAEKEYKK